MRLDLFEVEVKFVLLEGLDTLEAFSEISTSTTDKHTSETFFFYLNKLNYEKHIQTSNLTIYYDNKDLYVYYIINIYTKLQTNEGWNSNRNFRCGRNTR